MKPRFRRHRRRRRPPSNDPFFQKEGQESNVESSPAPFFEKPNIQAKLEISQTKNPLEQQANQVADQVVNQKSNQIGIEKKGVKASTKSEDSFEQPNANFATTLQQKKGTGSALPKDTLQEMNQSFGADFSSVSVHFDDVAQRMNQQIQAQAFTHGMDIFFNKGKFNPSTKEGKHLLAHELTHVLQQSNQIQREEDTETPKTWAQKVEDLEGLSGTDQNNGYKDLIQEAIGSGYTVHENTNEVADITEAMKQGSYVEWGANKEVNYDANLNTKTGDANQYGQAQYIPDDNGSAKIYIVLGPNSINKVGPQFTQMTNDHEQGHANDFKNQIANSNLHAATEGEELAIYTAGFTKYFLDLFLIDKTECSYDPVEAFLMLFETYKGAKKDERKTAFSAIKSYYENTIKGDSDNETKFKIWFQVILNHLGTDDPLVKKINGLDGLGFKKDTDELDHFNCTPE